MGRRKKGRDLSGWLLIDKPHGLGSTEAVGRVRRLLDARKAGHAGTLDPLATGLLAVAFGEATKTVPHASDGLKTYRFTVRWGAETTTDDLEGEVTRQADTRPDAEAIVAVLPVFEGDILQVPPAFSAVKVSGERAYDLARDGAAPGLAPRSLHVAKLALVEAGQDAAELELICGRGGYVRAIARDLGRALGCLGHVTELRRTAAGPFDLMRAAPPEALKDAAAAEAALLPLEAGLANLPEVSVTETGAAALRQGQAGEAIHAPSSLVWGAQAWASHDGRAVALGVWQGGTLKPARVFAVP